MYGPDSQEYDLPEARMEIYMADDKENLIEVLHMQGKCTGVIK